MEDAPKLSTGTDLSSMSGLVAARRSLLTADRRDRSGISQQEAPKLIGRFPGSFKETSSDSMTKQDQSTINMQCFEGHRNDSKDPVLVSTQYSTNNIHSQ